MPSITATPETKKETQDQLTPLFNVVLLDDDEHTYEYVVEMEGIPADHDCISAHARASLP